MKEDAIKSFFKECITYNKFVCDALLCSDIKKLDVEIADGIGAYSKRDDFNDFYHVIIGVKQHKILNGLCEKAEIKLLDLEYETNPTNCRPTCTVPIIVDFAAENEIEGIKKDIEGINCYSNCSTLADAIYKYAVSCTLFHEIGHLIKDTKEKSQIENEQDADDFSFDAMISCAHTTNYESSPVIIGTLMLLVGILNENSPQDIADDKVHPHILDRIWAFLRKLHLKEDSSLWLLCSDILEEWIIDNNIHLDNAYSKEGSSMDKFEHLCSEVKSYTSKL